VRAGAAALIAVALGVSCAYGVLTPFETLDASRDTSQEVVPLPEAAPVWDAGEDEYSPPGMATDIPPGFGPNWVWDNTHVRPYQ
jgi:hypothetical protein